MTIHPLEPNQLYIRPSRVKILFVTVTTYLCMIFRSSGQGTVFFGFEEYQVKDHPPFVSGTASVEDAVSSRFVRPSFEGDKYLVGVGDISINSPNGYPIQSYTLHLFLPQFQQPWYVTIGGSSVNAAVGNWQTFQGTFDSPVQSLHVTAYYSFETIAGDFGIDAVEFTTIPEPQTFYLFTLGLGAILLRHSKPPKTQSR
jgi:hypothetical protein